MALAVYSVLALGGIPTGSAQPLESQLSLTAAVASLERAVGFRLGRGRK